MNTGSALDIHDTIAAVSSASGSGLRSILRLSGPSAVAIAQQLLSVDADLPHQTWVSSAITVSGVHASIPVDGYVWRAPHSYTGQDLVELHGPGSPPLTDRLLQAVLTLGARPARPGEFTLRAFLAGKKDLAQAEAVHAVIQAREESELRLALSRLAGGVSRPLDIVRDDLLSLLADVEAELDFVEEDIQFVDESAILSRITAGLAQLTNLRRQLDQRTLSDRPIRVVIVGKPNAGKSSLFNVLIGQEAALVSAQADTTRDYLTARLEWDGIPIELIDTAGWRSATRTIESQAQALGREQLQSADVLLWCQPVSDAKSQQDRESFAVTHRQRLISVFTMCDLSDGSLAFEADSGSFVVVSSHTQHGIASLRVMISTMVRVMVHDVDTSDSVRALTHIESAMQSLRRAHEHTRENDPRELLAFSLRESLRQIGELVGAVYTHDLLDRIFSRFCIGK
ncbi:MAG: tRNA uridine-5-carboxymethylaminomethyl(34) synthesis GTPase MnmE [Bacteroidales bacterium]|nr:tRNA uridine-5-carboxymethylaminomethyl(34) synthesis GTPase MnmE [Bacteroidales bacterium]